MCACMLEFWKGQVKHKYWCASGCARAGLGKLHATKSYVWKLNLRNQSIWLKGFAFHMLITYANNRTKACNKFMGWKIEKNPIKDIACALHSSLLLLHTQLSWLLIVVKSMEAPLRHICSDYIQWWSKKRRNLKRREINTSSKIRKYNVIKYCLLLIFVILHKIWYDIWLDMRRKSCIF